MPDQAPAPDYIPPPRGSSPGMVVAIVLAVVLLLVVVCGLGLLGVGWLAYRQAEDIQIQPPPPVNAPRPPQAPQPVEQPGESPAPQ